MKNIAEVAVPININKTFSYSVPHELIQSIEIGKRVLIPFNRRQLTGYVVALGGGGKVEKVKDIIHVLDDAPLFSAGDLEFFKWLSAYYIIPLAAVIKTALPSGINKQSKKIFSLTKAGEDYTKKEVGKHTNLLKYLSENNNCSIGKIRRAHNTPNLTAVLRRLESKGLIDSKEIIPSLAKQKRVSAKEESDGHHDSASYDKKIIFNEEQKEAAKVINSAMSQGGYQPFLLHGITGSGKTEVYIQAAKTAVSEGKGVIVLVPEIALTPNLIQRFKRHFSKIGVMHSGIAPKKRYERYIRALNGELDVIIGARSAIFAPFKNLGLIIIDEEHEATYKQDDGFRYNARDIALVRAKLNKCPVILGSATPSVETFYNARTGKYKYLQLTKRVKESSLPEIHVVDMKEERAASFKMGMILSRLLRGKIEENLKNKKQTMLFLNRRGHSTFLVCNDCGEVETCPNCTISLTYHKTKNILICHYCGFKKELCNLCANCNGSRMKALGFGTEQVYDVISGCFPDANIFRMDSDTMTKKGAYEDFYQKMDDLKIDIVVGTQMIAKGHDFENVTVIGILNADTGLTIPDFRAEEKCFSLITQVSGRAGRGAASGYVVIQTLNPDNDYINYALHSQADEFYEKELSQRKIMQLPPFTRMINFKITSKTEMSGIDAFVMLKKITAQSLRNKGNKGISVMGPANCPIYKIKNKFRWQMLIKSTDSKQLHLFAVKLKEKLGKKTNPNYVKISIDVDPINML